MQSQLGHTEDDVSERYDFSCVGSFYEQEKL